MENFLNDNRKLRERLAELEIGYNAIRVELSKRIVALTNERDQLGAMLSDSNREMIVFKNKIKGDIDKLGTLQADFKRVTKVTLEMEDKILQLFSSLKRYGNHENVCPARMRNGFVVKCDCGFEKALKL